MENKTLDISKKVSYTKIMEIVRIDYHRNGVGGVGFIVAIVKPEVKDWPETVLVTRTPYDDEGVSCFVLDYDLVTKGEIRFGYNSWRGDQFACIFDPVLDEYWKNRYGYPFFNDGKS